MKLVLVLLLSLIGSFLGIYLQIPIGALIGSFVTILIAQLLFLEAKPLPKNIKFIAQVVIGGVAGLSIRPEMFSLKTVLLPAVVALLLHIALSVIFAFLLIKNFKVDFVTAFAATIPAGLSEITFIAQDLKADVTMVIITHLFRVTVIILTVPFIVKLLP
ncbi:AbrB family transcriptional regulator [Sutcliffiella cohnii]